MAMKEIVKSEVFNFGAFTSIVYTYNDGTKKEERIITPNNE